MSELQPRITFRLLRWPIGALMILVAVFAMIFAVARRESPEWTATKFAQELLVKYEPGFQSKNYRMWKMDKTPGGNFYSVRFRRVRGEGKRDLVAIVPVWRVDQERRFFWEPKPKQPRYLSIEDAVAQKPKAGR